MMDLVTFLRARLDEDEADALTAGSEDARRPWGDKTLPPEPWGSLLRGYLGGSIGEHCARHDPARVLADVAAKRALVDWAASWAAAGLADSHVGEIGFSVMRRLAAVYAEHPDYREEWKP